MDMYDMKPEAPAEYRGIWKPIRTNVPGFEITRAVPAAGQGRRQVLDRPLAAPRHRRPLHRRPPHAHRRAAGASGADTAGKSPSIGSIATQGAAARASRACRPTSPCPTPRSIGLRPGYFGANYLGLAAQPVRDRRRPERRRTSRSRTSNLAGALTLDRLEDRRGAARRTSTACAATSTPPAPWRRWTASTSRPTTSSPAPRPARRSTSAAKTRDSATATAAHSWGQSTLLARRLVEAGSHVRHRPLRRLGPSLGPEDGHGELPADGRQLRLGAVHRPATSAACSTRRWSCCAASSAARRG